MLLILFNFCSGQSVLLFIETIRPVTFFCRPNDTDTLKPGLRISWLVFLSGK